MAKRKAPEPDPDRLRRQQAGTYRSEDDRFEVREADAGWFVVDTTAMNEFGQELIHGPYPTLKVAGSALSDLRRANDAPKRRVPKNRVGKRNGARTAAPPERQAEPEPEPTSWIDELAKTDASHVRRMIAALEKEGVADAEAVVRRDRDGLLPAVATRRVEDRLAILVADLPEEHRDAARAITQRVADVLSAEGTSADRSLPGWALVEIGPGANPPGRRIDLRR